MSVLSLRILSLIAEMGFELHCEVYYVRKYFLLERFLETQNPILTAGVCLCCGKTLSHGGV